MNCTCAYCQAIRMTQEEGMLPFLRYMPRCPECGNKRCPKGSLHTLECSGSNESGQPGSIYL